MAPDQLIRKVFVMEYPPRTPIGGARQLALKAFTCDSRKPRRGAFWSKVGRQR